MPRTRTVLLAARFGVLFALVGALVTVMSVIDLVDGKNALTEVVVFGGILLVGVGLLVYSLRTQSTATARDLAAMPPEIRRDLPFGAQEDGATIILPSKLSWVIAVVVLGLASGVAAVYGIITEPGTGGIVVGALMGSIAVALIALAWRVRRIRWVIDARGLRRDNGTRGVEWAAIGTVRVDPRGRFLIIYGADGSVLLRFTTTLTEIAAGDLADVLSRGPAIVEHPSRGG